MEQFNCSTLGEPEKVYRERILDYLGVFPEAGGKYDLPPVSLSGLAKMCRANVSVILSGGHSYLLKIRNIFGKRVEVSHIAASDRKIAYRMRMPPVFSTGQSAFCDIKTAEQVYLRAETRSRCQNYLDQNTQLPPKLRLKFNFEIEQKEVKK